MVSVHVSCSYFLISYVAKRIHKDAETYYRKMPSSCITYFYKFLFSLHLGPCTVIFVIEVMWMNNQVMRREYHFEGCCECRPSPITQLNERICDEDHLQTLLFSRQVIETIGSTNYTYCPIITHCLLVIEFALREGC
jgi:hypothetical protein